MQKQEWKSAWQLAVTYIGTVVGAGFASGQEVMQFFTRFGPGAIAGLGIATLLFFLLGDFVMRLGRSRNSRTFGEVSETLFGSKFGSLVRFTLVLMLFGVTVAMVAGSGALLSEQVGLPFSVGALLAVIATAVTLISGMRGIISANSLIVPTMVGFIVIAFFTYTSTGTSSLASSIPATDPQPSFWQLLLSAMIYVGFNVGLSLTVLVPLGTMPKQRRTLALGALFGALGLGLMLLLMHILLASTYPQVLPFEVPMGFVARQLPNAFRLLFVVVLWSEIFSTLLANVFGIATELATRSPKSYYAFVILILSASYVISQVGFARIVAFAYPVFGYLGLIILLLLLLRVHRKVEV